MEGEWGKFEILHEEVEKLTKLLQKDTEEVEDISKQFEETLSEEEKRSRNALIWEYYAKA